VRRIRTWVVLALVGAAVIAFLGPMSTAVGFFSRGFSLDAKPSSPAKLLAKGAAVTEPVLVTCTGRFAYLTLTITERNGSTVASGTASNVPVPCNGGIQTMNVTVAAAGGRVFKKGTANADVDIFGCGSVCGEERSSALITIASK
jgi:hypothetical protein